MFVEPGDHWLPVFDMFEEVIKRFAGALNKALPELGEADLMWRFHFMIGTMCQTIMDPDRIEMLSEGRIDASNKEEVLKHLISFLSAGFKAEKIAT